MVDNDLLEQAILKFGTDYVHDKKNDELMYVCPFCESKIGKIKTDRKLYVNVKFGDYKKSGKFHCFRCGTKGRLGKSKIHIDDTSGVYKELLRMDEYENNVENDEDEDNMFYVKNTFIEDNTIAFNYLKNRGITREHINYYHLRLGVDDLYGRIVIPNQIFGREGVWTDMYQARSYLNQIPKYKNPDGAKKSSVVFNLHNQVKGGDIVIVEGAITAICGGRNCVGVYGCHPSKHQIKSILEKEPKSIICCLDNDPAGRQGNKELLEKLNQEYRGDLFQVIMPEGIDAADMGEEEFRKYVDKNKFRYYSSVYSSLMIFDNEN